MHKTYLCILLYKSLPEHNHGMMCRGGDGGLHTSLIPELGNQRHTDRSLNSRSTEWVLGHPELHKETPS